MSTELAAQTSVKDLDTISQRVEQSRLFGYTKAEVFTLCLLAEAEGLPAISALRRFHIIEGRPAMRADAMQAEFQKHGGRIKWLETTRVKCVAFFTHPEYQPDGITITVTFEELEKEGVTKAYDRDKGEWKTKKNWKQWPRQMLRARVISEGVRAVDPGIVVGIYTPEEVADFDTRDVPIQATATVATPPTDEKTVVVGHSWAKDQPIREITSPASRYETPDAPPAPSSAVAEIEEFFDRSAKGDGKRWDEKKKELEAEGKPTTIAQTEVTDAAGKPLARGEHRTWAGDLFALCRATNQEWEAMCKAHGVKFRSIASQGVLERFLIDWAIVQERIPSDYLLTHGREDRTKQNAFLEKWWKKYPEEFNRLASESLADLLNEAIESNGMHLSVETETPAEVAEETK